MAAAAGWLTAGTVTDEGGLESAFSDLRRGAGPVLKSTRSCWLAHSELASPRHAVALCARIFVISCR